MNLSLNKKIILIAALPLSFFLLLGAKLNFDYYHDFQHSKALLHNLTFINKITKLINSTQIERGLTGGFLKGGIKIEKLKNHRKLTDEFIHSMDEDIQGLYLKQKYKDKFKGILLQYKDIREQVSKKSITAAQSTKQYSEIVKFLNAYYSKIAKFSQFSNATASLKTLQTLEDVKEYAGLLRVTGTGIIAKNNPLDDKTFLKFQNLMQGVRFNINSNALSLSGSTEKLKTKFIESKEWKSTVSSFNIITLKHSEGNFNLSANSFFDKATLAINILNELIQVKLKETIDNVQEVKQNSFKQLSFLFLSLCIILSLISVTLVKVTKRLMRDLTMISQNLTEGSEHLNQISKELNHNGDSLSNSSAQLASGIQQSSSSLEEINAMVQKNAKASTQSSQSSSQSIKAANSGQKNIEQMIQSIEKIDQCNKEVRNFSKKTNDELGSILKIISSIAEKTTLINDIVFQTKLLSFNASVEAARAGEHGKGFSVVAEEIGNLANLSGQSANEINQILDESISNVEKIIANTGDTFKKLTSESELRVEEGIRHANQSKESLDEIHSSVNQVNKLVSEVSVASKEQGDGVHEVTSAIKDIDLIGHKNASLSQETLKVSSDLTTRSTELNHLAKYLENIVNGMHDEHVKVEKEGKLIEINRDSKKKLSA